MVEDEGRQRLQLRLQLRASHVLAVTRLNNMFKLNSVSIPSRTHVVLSYNHTIFLLGHRLGTMLVYCTKNCTLLDPSGDKALDIPGRRLVPSISSQ